MESTPLSLLERLRQSAQQAGGADWDRLVDLLAPLLYHWSRKRGLQEHDARDLVQDLFVKLLKELPTFEHRGKKSFRAWVGTLLLNLWRDRFREADPAGPLLGAVAVPDPRDAIDLREFNGHLAQQALRLMQRDFEPTTWRACWETKVMGRRTSEVAAELGITVAAVHAANYRILKRLREEMEGFLD